MSEGNEMLCPWCGAELPGKPGQYVKCRHCGSDIHWGAGKPYKTKLDAAKPMEIPVPGEVNKPITAERQQRENTESGSDIIRYASSIWGDIWRHEKEANVEKRLKERAVAARNELKAISRQEEASRTLEEASRTLEEASSPQENHDEDVGKTSTGFLALGALNGSCVAAIVATALCKQWLNVETADFLLSIASLAWFVFIIFSLIKITHYMFFSRTSPMGAGTRDFIIVMFILAALPVLSVSGFCASWGVLKIPGYFKPSKTNNLNKSSHTADTAHLDFLRSLPKASKQSLSGLDLKGADLTNMKLFNASLEYSNFKDAKFNNSNLSFANFRRADLTDADLTAANLRGASLRGANLTGANLTGANLSEANLSDAILTGANLTDADLEKEKERVRHSSFLLRRARGLQTGQITGQPASLPTNWKLTGGYLIGSGVSLTNADLADAILTGVDISHGDLTDADLAGADLTGANLYGTNLSDAILTGANLTDANLNYANLTGANLGDVDLSGANLTDADLTEVDLTNVDLTSVVLDRVNFYLANLTNTKLNNTKLTDAIFRGANLTDADLSAADLTNADLASANLRGVQSGGITGIPVALPSNWQCNNGYLIGPGANLRGADLTDADLTDADLTDADLTDVAGAAKYSSATIFPAGFDPVAAGWTFVN